MQVEPEKLGAKARAAIQDHENELLLSAASAWEIALKHSLGRLNLPLTPAEYVPSRMTLTDTKPLAVSMEHALRVAALPMLHRDPIDRLLIAQCQVDGLHLLTADRQFRAYSINVIWAESD
jgi:PIN domain nuclease of toxin-antitoxin system